MSGLLAHDDHDFTGLAHGPADIELAAIDHVVITIFGDPRFNVGGIGGRHFRFGHGKGTANTAFQQRLQPLFFLGFVAVFGQHFHIPGIRCGTVERLGSDAAATQFFRQRGIFQIAQASAVLPVFLGQEQVPQTFGFGFFLQLIHDRRGFPRAFFQLLEIGRASCRERV